MHQLAIQIYVLSRWLPGSGKADHEASYRVTPFVMTGVTKACTENDYINTKPQDTRRKSRTNGRWKQDNAGWSLTDSPLPSPIVQSADKNTARATSVRRLQERFVVDMPSVDNPYPQQMTNEQIEHYQQSIKSSYGMEQELDAKTASPPSKIVRKEVGNAITRRQLRTNDKKRPLRGQLLDESTNNPYLGGLTNSSPPKQPTTLSQYLPKIELLHPSHFANLPSSYRKPSRLVPARPQQSSPSPETAPAVDTSPSRPKVQRQDGAITVPKVRTDSRSRGSGNKALQSRMPSASKNDAAAGREEHISLNGVRAKLTQTCRCSKCIGSKARVNDANPASRGNANRKLSSDTKKSPATADILTSEKTNGEPDKDKTHLENNPSSPDHTPPLPKPSKDRSTSTSTTINTTTLTRSATFLRRVEKVTTFLDLVPLPDPTSTRLRLLEGLKHIVLTFYHAFSAVRTLNKDDAQVKEYADAVRKVVVAMVYGLVLLKVVVTVVRVVGLVMDIVDVVSWPARGVGVVVKWCLVG